MLTIDNRPEAVTSLHCKSWELAADKSVIFILWDGQQPRLVLCHTVFHLGFIQPNGISAGVAVISRAGQPRIPVRPIRFAVIIRKVIGNKRGSSDADFHPKGSICLCADPKGDTRCIAQLPIAGKVAILIGGGQRHWQLNILPRQYRSGHTDYRRTAQRIAARKDQRIRCRPGAGANIFDAPDFDKSGTARQQTPIWVGDIGEELRRITLGLWSG